MAKFPILLPAVTRKPKSVAQNVAFARGEITSALRFLDQPEHAGAREALEAALERIEALKLPNVLDLGCWRCGGDVPADNPELVADRICRPCADDYDIAVAERNARARTARKAA